MFNDNFNFTKLPIAFMGGIALLSPVTSQAQLSVSEFLEELDKNPQNLEERHPFIQVPDFFSNESSFSTTFNDLELNVSFQNRFEQHLSQKRKSSFFSLQSLDGLHQIQVNYMGDAREFNSSYNNSHLDPLTVADPFKKEILKNFTGVNLQTGVQLDDDWSWTFGAKVGRTFPENKVDLTYLGTYDYLNQQEINIAPLIREEMYTFVDETFDTIIHEVESALENVSLEQEKVDSFFESLETKLYNYNDNLPRRVINYFENENVYERISEYNVSLDDFSFEEKREKLYDFLEETREKALGPIENLSDREIQDAVDTIIYEVSSRTSLLDEEIPAKTLAAAVVGFSAKSSQLNEQNLETLIDYLRLNQGNSNELSLLFQTQLERRTDSNKVYIGLDMGQIAPGDWIDGEREYYVSLSTGHSSVYGVKDSYGYDVRAEIIGFQNYLNLKDVNYGIASLYNQISHISENMPNTIFHYGVGTSYDLFYGGSLHQEIGFYHFFQNPLVNESSFYISLGHMQNFDSLEWLFDDHAQYNNISFYEKNTHVARVGFDIIF